MNKRLAIIFVTALAVAAVFYLKTLQPKATTSPVSEETQTRRFTLFLFHNPNDQDEECRRIYAFADQAEKELSDKVIVKRPDVEANAGLLSRYSVRVLPTIVILSPDGREQARFEGEGDIVAADLKKALEKLKRQ